METRESENSTEGDVLASEAGTAEAVEAAPVDYSDFGDGFPMKEGVLEEVMGILEMEEDGSKSPSSVLWVSPFVTINGNEESCGPSFSDTSTTVMASLDIGCFSIPYLMGLVPSDNVLPAGVRATSLLAESACVPAVEAATEAASAASMRGRENSVSWTSEVAGSADELDCDAESDDVWLARVLGSTV